MASSFEYSCITLFPYHLYNLLQSVLYGGLFTLEKSLSYYVHCFTNLRRSASNGGAPHKPILLLSVIEMFEKGLLSTSEVFILPELVASFRSLWSKIVTTQHSSTFSLPFFHMKSEPFWKLLPNAGYELWVNSGNRIVGFKNLLNAVRCAYLDSELVTFLLDPQNRDVLRLSLLHHYFRTPLSDLYPTTEDSLLSNWLETNSEEYKKQIFNLKNTVDENTFQEEIFIRSGIFRREIPKIYNSACAISELKIDATANIRMVDACHIVPFSETYDDSINNGIALCPNLHRAFDRGLLTLS